VVNLGRQVNSLLKELDKRGCLIRITDQSILQTQLNNQVSIYVKLLVQRFLILTTYKHQSFVKMECQLATDAKLFEQIVSCGCYW